MCQTYVSIAIEFDAPFLFNLYFSICFTTYIPSSIAKSNSFTNLPIITTIQLFQEASFGLKILPNENMFSLQINNFLFSFSFFLAFISISLIFVCMLLCSSFISISFTRFVCACVYVRLYSICGFIVSVVINVVK